MGRRPPDSTLTKPFDDVLPGFCYTHGNREATMRKLRFWIAALTSSPALLVV